MTLKEYIPRIAVLTIESFLPYRYVDVLLLWFITSEVCCPPEPAYPSESPGRCFTNGAGAP